MIVQNFKDVPNWNKPGTHKDSCWDILQVNYDLAADAVGDKKMYCDKPEYCVVIKYYE